MQLGSRSLRLFLFGFAVVATIAVSVAPRLPSSTASLNDKFGHVLVYGVDGVLAAAAFPGVASLGWALAGLLAMGGTLELVQGVLPRRQGSWLDAGANALGLVGGGLILVRRARARRV